ncbi:acyl-CoA oxidase [Rickenella mellea]|uniref:Acyl-coenzyme A oxidase n=1 Tax=Rickenella mellea TaxID=50990 RepID=A0A4Y7QHC6_9AGAM|nr:acyl-CoA oxidase [Rickenella mellea]
MAPIDPNQQTAKDMLKAREKSSLNIPVLRNFIYGGHAEWETYQKMVQILSSDPTFEKSSRAFLTRTEMYNRALAMTLRMQKLKDEHKWSPRETTIASIALDEGMPITLHQAAFEPVTMSQGSPELLKKYGALIANRGIVGCYLQTELGHGSNVSQLETTATFIPETKEFEIHSPTVTSTKWWIGSLGKTSTHGVVQARLILPGGKDAGPHLFFIQLRSLEDHRVLPGIQIGDIGPKAMGGYAAVDHGFARFNHVRIPHEQMLSKFAQVTDEGKYVQPPHAKISYGGMLYIRSTMVSAAGRVMAKAATVSIRYATVRRQGNKDASGLERQVITYPSTYYRLLPILSHAYVYIQLGRNLSKSFDAMASRLASGDTSLLAEIHATTSGLKVLCTTTSIQDVEVARRSMGGHGYSAFAGLGRVYADQVPSATYEGDNFVLDQQVVRGALKSLRALKSAGNKAASNLTPSSAYLRLLLPSSSAPPTITNETWSNSRALILLLEWRAARIVASRATMPEDSDASVDQRVSRAVSEAFVAAQVGEMISGLPFGGYDGRVIEGLFRLYLLTNVEAALVDILSFGLLPSTNQSGDPTSRLRAAINILCRELLPEAIPLTDAFGFSDWELDSALGVYDGRVYEALWERAQSEPLNQTEVPAGYESFIKPLLERGQRLASEASKSKL